MRARLYVYAINPIILALEKRHPYSSQIITYKLESQQHTVKSKMRALIQPNTIVTGCQNSYYSQPLTEANTDHNVLNANVALWTQKLLLAVIHSKLLGA